MTQLRSMTDIHLMGRQNEGIKGKLTLRDMGGLPPENMWIQRPEYEKKYEGLVGLLIIIQLYTEMNVLSTWLVLKKVKF
jgi:hypothetical protein